MPISILGKALLLDRGAPPIPRQEPRSMIVVSNVTKTYAHGVAAIRNVSLSIKEGEFTVIFGPSGVGKSTFLRCLNYLVKPTAGEIIIQGQRLSALSAAELRKLRSHIGMIFQEFHLVNRMSVLTNVMCGSLHTLSFLRALTYSFPDENLEKGIQALRQAGLHDEKLYFRRADTLSGGQKQRVAIARMLMQDPKIILADEPIASLDIKMQHEIMELISTIAKQNKITVVMSLHHLDLAKQFASRIFGFSEGQVVFDGTPDSLGDDVIRQVFNLVDNKVASIRA